MRKRHEVNEAVKIFYEQNFKTIFINSTDGVNFTKPVGIFVSLGLTTSLDTIKRVQGALKQYLGCETKIVEIKSVETECSEYMNTITKTENISKYPAVVPENCYNREQILEKYGDSKNQNWRKIFDSIETNSNFGWDNCAIWEYEPGEFRIFYRYINYLNSVEDNCEYRIGIYVGE